MIRFRSNRLFFALTLLFLIGLPATVRAADPVFGVLEGSPTRAATTAAAGVHLTVFGLAWARYEPEPGSFSEDYAEAARHDLAAFRGAGQEVVLDLGFQYVPRWVFTLPNSQFADQYGDAFVPGEPGDAGANAVFNAKIRDLQFQYLAHVFQDLGTDFFAVRLGWGHYGELCYPFHKYAGHLNCYWGFDPVAQGKAPGLPESLKPCPVPGWIPGTPSAGHADASRFVNWYLDALADYQNWQVHTVRQFYQGRLAILYASWGVRPGRLDQAIAGDLSGTTQEEITGEIPRGYDFARLVAGIDDPNVLVYSTWLDANFGDETSPDPAQWNPMRYLCTLAEAHQPQLDTWGENTGRNDLDAMERSFDRMRHYHMIGMVWAFEPDLYAPKGKYARLADYQNLIAGVPPAPAGG